MDKSQLPEERLSDEEVERMVATNGIKLLKLCTEEKPHQPSSQHHPLPETQHWCDGCGNNT